MDAINTIHCGAVIDDTNIVFYKETFNEWALRLFKVTKKEKN